LNEDTLVKTLALPFGEKWAWYADANVIVLSPCLDQAGREAALCELQAKWRRSGIRVLDGGGETAAQTVPVPRTLTAAQ
jgi:hypothetical protein